MENEVMENVETAMEVVEPVKELVVDNRRVGVGVGLGIGVGALCVIGYNKFIKPCIAKAKAKRAAKQKKAQEAPVIDAEVTEVKSEE